MKRSFSNKTLMKKLLFAVPVVVLLAAGCNSSPQPSTQDNNSQPAQQQTNPDQTNPVTPTPSDSSSNSSTSTTNGASWQGTLQKSDSAAKGNYMISVNGHNVYINTSRDYSNLVGKQVSVSYKGSMDNFGLVDITAQ